jgi:hypothetical protein
VTSYPAPSSNGTDPVSAHLRVAAWLDRGGQTAMDALRTDVAGLVRANRRHDDTAARQAVTLLAGILLTLTHLNAAVVRLNRLGLCRWPEHGGTADEGSAVFRRNRPAGGPLLAPYGRIGRATVSRTSLGVRPCS